MTNLDQLTKEAGFVRGYAFAPAPFPYYKRRLEDGALHMLGRGLDDDPIKTHSWANAILLLLYAYQPLPPEKRVSGYYYASNAAYHAANGLMEALQNEGVRAERIDVPIRELAMLHGAGTPLKNGLTKWREFGSRAAVQTLIARLPEPVRYSPDEPMEESPCKTCSACQTACPATAIDAEGFHYARCIRGNIDGETLPAWVMEKLPSLLGCEVCQYACPVNAGIPYSGGDAAEFDLKRLLTGDIKPALTKIGKNQNKGGRLPAHAAVLAARENRCDLLPEIRALKMDDRPLVAESATWAEARLCLNAGHREIDGCVSAESIVK